MTNQPTPRCGLCDGPLSGDSSQFDPTYDPVCDNKTCPVAFLPLSLTDHATIRARRIEDAREAFLAGRSSIFSSVSPDSNVLCNRYIAERFPEPKEEE
jgi:hypothetical protein